MIAIIVYRNKATGQNHEFRMQVANRKLAVKTAKRLKPKGYKLVALSLITVQDMKEKD